MFKQLGRGAIALALIALAMPAAAQFSDSYKFLKGVREADGQVVTQLLNQPGTTVVNTKDQRSGESALHIVIKRRDLTWLNFLLSKGANPNIRDTDGNTPLAAAAQVGFTEGARLLLEEHANPNLGNSRGETPLILAVHNRDLAMAQALINGGADPKQPDRIAGKSARDYAAEDRRSPAMLKLLDSAKPKSAVKMGPSL